MAWQELLLVPIAYGLGCLATGYYLVRWRRGIDIRTVGSGTTGAFNVARVLGAPGFAVTLAGDVLKGALAVALARSIAASPPGMLLVMAAVVLGHDFPVQLGFRGGNGLAAAGGALAVFDGQLALGLAVLFGLSLPVLAGLKALGLPVRYYTPSKVTVLAAPLVALWLGREAWLAAGLAAIVAVIMLTIRSNLRRLAGDPAGQHPPRRSRSG